MADILTRLLLNTSQFDANLNGAKQSVNSFQGSVSSMAKTAGAGIAKFAGGIGLAIGAGEAFMSVIRGSQATSDAFDNNLNACKDSVNSFFEAISTGDFSYFEDGLIAVFNRAKELSAMLDTLGDMTLAYNSRSAGISNQIQRNLNIIRDNTSSKEEIEKAKKDNADLLVEYKKLSQKLIDEKKKSAVQMYNVYGGITDGTFADVKLYLEGANMHLYDHAIDKYRKDLAALESKKQEAIVSSTIVNNRGVFRGTNHEVDKIENEIKTFKEKNSVIRKASDSMNKIIDKDERDRLYSTYDSIDTIQTAIETMEGRVIKGNNKVNNLIKQSSKSSQKSDLFPKDQVLEINKQISDLSKQLATETSEAAKDSVLKTIDELNERKDSLTLSTGDIDKQLSDLNKKMAEATTDEMRRAIQKTIDELQNKKIILNVVAKSDPGSIIRELGKQKPTLGSKDKDKTSPNYGKYSKDSAINKAMQSKAPTDTKALRERLKRVKENTEANNNFAWSLGAIGDAMSSVSGMVGEDTAAWLQWGSNVFATTGQAIANIMEVIGAKKADSIAGAIQQSQSVPFPANIFAIGASVAEVIAAFASIPAFETGGVIPGASFSGDKVLARVNSGEMILNSRQQSKLFKLANSGNLSSGNRDVSVTGDIRVRGADLYLSLKNYLKITGKKL